MVDRLHVVKVFQHIQQFLHLRHVVPAQVHRIFGAHRDFRQLGFQTGGIQRLAHRLETERRGQHFDRTVLVHHHVIGAGLQRHFHNFVLTGARRKNQLPAMLELERHRTFGAHIAAVFAERVAHLGHGAHPVVGHGVHHDRRAPYAVALIPDFFVTDAFQVASRLVDIAFDGVGRHIRRLGFFHRQAQARVDGQVTAARARRHHDFTDHAGPHLAAFFVLAALAVLNIGPFAVSCHAKSFKNSLPYRLYFLGTP